MEKELEQMLQTVCSKGIKEASSEEIYAALLQWSKEKMNGMKTQRGRQKTVLHFRRISGRETLVQQPDQSGCI